MKNRNWLMKLRESFWPVTRRKVTVVRRSESLLNVCGLAWIQTAESSAAITAGLGFSCLRKVKERDTPSEQLVYNALRYAMIVQIDETKVLESFSHVRSCILTVRQITNRKTSEIDNRNFFT